MDKETWNQHREKVKGVREHTLMREGTGEAHRVDGEDEVGCGGVG